MNIGYFTLREKALNCLLLNVYFHLAISRVGEIVVITLDIGKTLNSIDLVNLMSSISVRFNSFLFFYSIFNEHNFQRLLSLALNGRSGWTRTIDLTLIRRAL